MSQVCLFNNIANHFQSVSAQKSSSKMFEEAGYDNHIYFVKTPPPQT